MTGLDLLNKDVKLRINNAFNELSEFKKLQDELKKEYETQKEKKTNPIPPNLRDGKRMLDMSRKVRYN